MITCSNNFYISLLSSGGLHWAALREPSSFVAAECSADEVMEGQEASSSRSSFGPQLPGMDTASAQAIAMGLQQIRQVRVQWFTCRSILKAHSGNNLFSLLLKYINSQQLCRCLFLSCGEAFWAFGCGGLSSCGSCQDSSGSSTRNTSRYDYITSSGYSNCL